MPNAKELCLALLNANTQSEVIRLLKDAGYWDNKDAWRLYGDKEGNFAQVGNQSAKPEAALVEKLVNSVDARLMNECLVRGVLPESPDAPQSIRAAVARYFEGKEITDDEGGSLCNWASGKRTEQSHFITLAATGGKPTRGKKTEKMCLTIADQGEGQSPNRLPLTILSLNAKNKQCIRFVQGKFNMGGSGVLRFCGEHGLQLVISRRNPALAANEQKDSSVDDWGFTIVRREAPSDESGEPVHSEFTYLAPVSSDEKPRKGEVLSFGADSLPLMPIHDEPYSRDVTWATVIKLYEYETSVGQSNILLKDGLLFALERLLPEVALPVRLHECRAYKGVKERSFETALSGLVVRLEEGRGDNLEIEPLSVHLEPSGMRMDARIYAFKEDRASTYVQDEGVIFTINGQAHGHFPRSIFSRPKAVGLPRLKDSLLVLLDCSELGTIHREDLFMTSRDRLTKNPIRYTVEREVEEMLKNNAILKELQQKRKEAELESKLSEEKPLEEVLGKVLKASPTLKTLFLRGQRLSRAFAGRGGGRGENADGPKNEGDKNFIGNRHPSYFKIKNHEYGKVYLRNCEKDRRCRIKFETDVENGYFQRPTDRGRFELEIVESEGELSALSHNFSLENGEAHLSLALPPEVEVDSSFTIQASVFDPTLSDPFVNVIELNVKAKQPRSGGPARKKNKGVQGGDGDNTSPEGISLPRIELVRENDSYWQKYHFTIDTACHVISDPIDADGKTMLDHTFYINLDNNSLRTELKHSKQDPRLLEAKFKYGTVLLGLAMLHDDESRQKRNGNLDSDEEDTVQVQEKIRTVTEAIAPVLLPMIDQLGGLDEADLEAFGDFGDDE